MTTFEAVELDFAAAAMPATTRELVALVATDPMSHSTEDDWLRFIEALATVAGGTGGVVDSNEMRLELSNGYGLTIPARRYSGFWLRASRAGLLVRDGWSTNLDVKSGNGGKPCIRYRLSPH